MGAALDATESVIPTMPGHRPCTARACPAGQLTARPGAQRSQASMKASRSPSSTPSTLPVSCSVRRSLTIWYGAST